MKSKTSPSDEYDSEEEDHILEYDDFLDDSDGIEMPHFVNAESIEQDDEEIEYYARKLGISEDKEWDQDSILLGYAKITEGITAANRSANRKKKAVKMIEAVRAPEEEAARRDFTGLLNRIAPSNYQMIAARITQAFASHPLPVSISMFTRCITQRIFSDAPLPPIFLNVYSQILKETPDAIQPVIEELQKRANDPKCINIKPFFAALGEDFVNRNSMKDLTDDPNKRSVKVDEQVSQLTTIARKLNMTTDVRNSIFNSIMTGIDVNDAFAKIGKLNLSKAQRKEIPFIIIECCRSEETYNPYYAALATEFITYDDDFIKDLRISLKNTMKLMVTMKFTAAPIRNIAFFFEELIENKHADLNILKGIKLTQLPVQGTLFVNLLFRELLQKCDPSLLLEQIEMISKKPNFAADLKQFLEQRLLPFVTEKTKNFPKEKLKVLRKSIDLLSSYE